MKKLFVVFGFLILIVVILVSLLPVSYDAGICGGGFKSYVFQENIEELDSIILEQYDSVRRLSDDKKVIESIEWDGRKIMINIVYLVEGETKEFTFIGKRYWIEKYKWAIK